MGEESGRAADAEPDRRAIDAKAAEALSDADLTDAVESNVWNAGFERRHSVYDDNCSVLYREAVRRENEGLYKIGYARAARSAGIDA